MTSPDYGSQDAVLARPMDQTMPVHALDHSTDDRSSILQRTRYSPIIYEDITSEEEIDFSNLLVSDSSYPDSVVSERSCTVSHNVRSGFSTQSSPSIFPCPTTVALLRLPPVTSEDKVMTSLGAVDQSSRAKSSGSVTWAGLSSVTSGARGVHPGSLNARTDHVPDVTGSNKESKTTGRRKKTSRPVKSPRPEDPKFQGVTVQFRSRMYKNKIQFLITAYFNCRKLTRRRWRHGVLLSTSAPIFADDARDPLLPGCARVDGTRDDVLPGYPRAGGTFDPSTHGTGATVKHDQEYIWYSSGKQCASCNTRKTPLWRDAEDGTPLCNACGIRYKKYRVRCGHCWFVPKKESKTNPVCTNCGEILRYSFFRLRPALIN